MASKTELCKTIAQSLVDFGYPDVTPEMITDCWEAFERGDETLPHGVVGMFAQAQLEEIEEARPDLLQKARGES